MGGGKVVGEAAFKFDGFNEVGVDGFPAYQGPFTLEWSQQQS